MTVLPRLESGAELGALRLTRRLGEGTLGAVWMASDRDGRPCAVKVLHAHLAADAALRDRFEREAEVGLRLRHPLVVPTLEVGRVELPDGVRPYLVMEYVDGQTLAAWVDQRGVLRDRALREVGEQASLALQAVHAAGAVHRKVKPANLVRDRATGKLRLLDLGLAGALDLRTASDPIAGTVPYAAPEQLRGGGHVVDGRADLYALGVSLFELASGSVPFAEDTVTALAEKERPPRRLRPVARRTSPFMSRVVARLMAVAPALRFQSAGELATVLAAGESSTWWREGGLRGTSETVADPVRPDSNLPEGRFTGDAEALARVSEALAAGGRLVTVVGSPGLALEAGRRRRRHQPGGVWCCRMAGARDEGAVLRAMGRGLAVPLIAADPAGQLDDAIAHREGLLLLLEGTEAPHAPWVARWLALAPGPTVIASGDPLGLDGEVVIRSTEVEDEDLEAPQRTDAATLVREADLRPLAMSAEAIDALLAACRAALAAKDVDAAVTMAGAVARVLHHRGPRFVAAALLDEAEALAGARPALDRARDLLTAVPTEAVLPDDAEEATDLLEAQLHQRRDAGDVRGEATTLARLGEVAAEAGHLLLALRRLESALEVHLRCGLRREAAPILEQLGRCHGELGEVAEAEALLGEAIRLGRPEAGVRLGMLLAEAGRTGEALEGLRQVLLAVEDRAVTAQVRGHIGRIHLEGGDLALADDWLTRAVNAHRELQDRRALARALADLARVARERGVDLRARDLYLEALAHARDVGDREREAAVRVALAAVDVRCGTSLSLVEIDAGLDMLRDQGATLAVLEGLCERIGAAAELGDDTAVADALAELEGVASRARLAGSRVVRHLTARARRAAGGRGVG